jgi:Flp pilus assembly protein TadG
MRKLRRLFKALSLAKSGVAAVEFALVLPFLLIAGVSGTELAWYMMVSMRVNQVAIQVADNASRIGDTSTIADRKIYEADINDVLIGAGLDGGTMLNLLTKGRVIISSLEVNASNQQYIHWQRCGGSLTYNSSYGVQGDVKASGMGPTGQEVSALTGDAVIFVEIAYDYTPLVTGALISNKRIKSVASFVVRDDRDLSQIYQRSPAATVSTC